MNYHMGAGLANQIWHTTVALRPSEHGPVTARHAPLLAAGTVGLDGAPRTSILWPSGLRINILLSLGEAGRPFRLPTPVPEPPHAYTELERLNADLEAFTDLPQLRQAQVLACLNVLTEQTAALRLIPTLSKDYLSDPVGCRVLYEAARAIVRLGQEIDQAGEVLAALCGQEVNPEVAVSAGIQLGSTVIRIHRDLDRAAGIIAMTDERRCSLDAGVSTFVRRLLDSRYFRLEALLLVRRGDSGAAAAALDAAEAAADEIRTCDDGYSSLVAEENYRILAESRLKAAAIRRSAADLATWIPRLLDTDPQDPFAWRCVAEACAKCGYQASAATALAAVTGMGGPGVFSSIAVLRKSASAQEPAELHESLLARLADLCEPPQERREPR